MKRCSVCGVLVVIGMAHLCGAFEPHEVQKMEAEAVNVTNGRLHFIHGAEAESEVEISARPVAAVGSNDVTVALTGQSATFTQGTFAPVKS